MRRSRALLLPLVLLSAIGAATLQDVDAAHYLDQFIDRTADPRTDFWQYSVGKWLKEHPIPPSERSWGIYNVIQDETYQRLRGLSESAAASSGARGTSAQKIGDFWHAATDTVAIARQGFAPL